MKMKPLNTRTFHEMHTSVLEPETATTAAAARWVAQRVHASSKSTFTLLAVL